MNRQTSAPSAASGTLLFAASCLFLALFACAGESPSPTPTSSHQADRVSDAGADAPAAHPVDPGYDPSPAGNDPTGAPEPCPGCTPRGHNAQ